MKHKAQRPDYRPYPEPQRTRGGCKVGWNIYASLEDAQKCAAAASHNAEIKWEQGYDFGYCSPGSVRQVADGYEVCIP